LLEPFFNLSWRSARLIILPATLVDTRGRAGGFPPPRFRLPPIWPAASDGVPSTTTPSASAASHGGTSSRGGTSDRGTPHSSRRGRRGFFTTEMPSARAASQG